MDNVIKSISEEVIKFAELLFEGEEFLFILDDETNFGEEGLFVGFEKVLENIRLDVVIFKGDINRLNKAVVIVFVIHSVNR